MYPLKQVDSQIRKNVVSLEIEQIVFKKDKIFYKQQFV